MTRRNHKSRQGVTAVEVLVAFTLLSVVLAVATPLVVRHNRLLAGHRDYQLALDELSNQLERLTALPEDELTEAVERIAPSEFAAARLPGAELKGKLEPADVGQRLTLQLWWDEPQRRAAPVTLAAWITPDAQAVGWDQLAPTHVAIASRSAASAGPPTTPVVVGRRSRLDNTPIAGLDGASWSHPTYRSAP